MAESRYRHSAAVVVLVDWGSPIISGGDQRVLHDDHQQISGLLLLRADMHASVPCSVISVVSMSAIKNDIVNTRVK